MRETRIAVNGRFLTMPVTGVQRYARELVARLPDATGSAVTVLAPGSAGTEPGGSRLPRLGGLSSWTGLRGHVWEQLVLPGRTGRLGSDLLLSLCNAGPLGVEAQVVGLMDSSPFCHPDVFRASFVRFARTVWPVLARRARAVVTLSERTREELVEALGVDPARVHVVPPAVGPPFAAGAVGAPCAGDAGPAARDGPPYCIAVGGHDPRKNVRFLLEWWPAVHRDLGLRLRVAQRSVSGPHPAFDGPLPAGVDLVDDPDDQQLAALYAGAVCLLWPSRYEGFGMPPLEAMALGTPFLSTDAGAARELAVRDDQVLPLDAAVWQERLRTLVADGPDGALAADCRARAAQHTWEASAARLAQVVQAALA